MDAVDLRRAQSVSRVLSRDQGHTTLAEIRLLLVLSAAFATAYAQYPLYYLAQNEYFFYALRNLNQGYLRSDWLAGTGDAWPIFTRVVELTLQYLDPVAFYVYFLVFAGLYAYSVFGIVSTQMPLSRSIAHTAAFFALLTAMHSPAVSQLTRAFTGVNVRIGILEGVASQRILWDMFQPGAFGVFLLLSILVFLRGNAVAAVVLSSLAALVHPGYLISAGTLTAAYLILLYQRGERRHVVAGLGALALAIVLPVVIHTYTVFAPTSPELAARAREILVHVRLARHADVARWFDATAVAKLAAVMAALIVVRRSALFWILLLPSGAAVMLTLAHLLTGSDALALLFPWRVSVFLVPLAVSLLVARLVSALLGWRGFQSAAASRAVVVVSVAVLAACVGAGALTTQRRFNSRTGPENAAILDVVARTKTLGDSYLVPPMWRNFRLRTGAPTFVDYWFIPYNDAAVVEWFTRLQLANAFYGADGIARCRLLSELGSGYHVTHVVLRTQDEHGCQSWRLLARNRGYSLYGVDRQ